MLSGFGENRQDFRSKQPDMKMNVKQEAGGEKMDVKQRSQDSEGISLGGGAFLLESRLSGTLLFPSCEASTAWLLPSPSKPPIIFSSQPSR